MSSWKLTIENTLYKLKPLFNVAVQLGMIVICLMSLSYQHRLMTPKR